MWLSRVSSSLGRLKAWAVALTWAVLCLQPGIALADVSAQLTAPPQVEVGQSLRVELNVSSDEGAPQSPRLDTPPGFAVRGPSVSTRFSTSINGWSAQTKREITASWILTPPSTGSYTLGPARASVDGKSVESNAVKIQVVPAGTLPQQAPQPQRRRPGSLFDDDDDDFFSGFPGFGRPGRSILDDMLQRQGAMFPEAPADYRLPRAPDTTAFLDASVAPGRAVVGQQITLRIVAYGAVGRFRESDTREPRRPDFYSVPLIESSIKEQMYSVKIGQTDYLAVKIREYALFPLKAGKLEIGPMQMAFYGSNYISRTTQQPIVRESQPLIIEVGEPPLTGRPLGYQLGDVGNFSISASVSPRSVKAGESFSVVAVVQGEGNVPQALRVPEQKGLQWLEPTLTEQVGPNAKGRIAGKRTFTYIVQASRTGTVDLGALSLPFYNPTTGKYQTATAQLGQLEVTPADAAQTATSSSLDSSAPTTVVETKLSELANARPTLRAYAGRNSTFGYSPWLWLALLAGPLGVLGGQLTAKRARAWAARRRTTQISLSHQTSQELRRAKDLQSNNDPDAAVAALERAVFLGLENATGIKARAVLRDELQTALCSSGLAPEQAQDFAKLLAALETYRFARQGDITDLLKQATSLISKLPTRRQRVATGSEAT